MEECIFCRIIAGEVPAAKLIETDKVLSFLDIAPVNPGHCLVMPKRHVGTLLDMTQHELHACMFTVQRVARAATRAVGAAGFNVLQNNDRCAGQIVPHVHFHVIPRSPDDGFQFGWRQTDCSKDQLREFQRKVRELL
jgi:histidine triad (HIT) family protein